MDEDNIKNGPENEADKGESGKRDNEAVRREVGSVSFRALQKARGLIKPGVRLIDVAEAVERFVVDDGYEIAFPINLSVNSEAAHYTPKLGDEKTFQDNDVVKIDFGAAKDGILGDCACTVDLSGRYQKLVESVERALESVLPLIKPGTKVRDIGKSISDTVEGMGFKPIKNLGGHGIGVHDLHTDPFIPNFDNGDDTELEEGDIIAIEPFVTTESGRGYVANSDVVEIFSLVYAAPTRSVGSRALLNAIVGMNRTEPFAIRWFGDIIKSRFEMYAAVSELFRNGAIEPHPMLVELGGGIVAQHEAQVTVVEGGCEVLTK